MKKENQESMGKMYVVHNTCGIYSCVRSCDSHVRSCDSHVGSCDSHVGSCDSHVRSCDSHEIM